MIGICAFQVSGLVLLTANFLGQTAFGCSEECYALRVKSAPPCSGIQEYKPWPEDEECSKYTVKLSPAGTWKPTAFVSFPCTAYGVKIIQLSTGFVAGSVSPVLPSLEPRAQIHCGLRPWEGKTIVQGTRDVMYHLLPKWYRATLAYEGEEASWPVLSKLLFQYRGIVVVRNPWITLSNTMGAIEKEMRNCPCRYAAKGSSKTPIGFDEENFQTFLRKGAKLWVDHLKEWIGGSDAHGSEILLVRFENLRTDTATEMRKIMAFLNVTVDEGRLNCMLKDDQYIEDPLPSHDLKLKVAEYFTQNAEAQAILEDGMKEINQLLKSRSLNEIFDYKMPSYEELVEGAALTPARRPE